MRSIRSVVAIVLAAGLALLLAACGSSSSSSSSSSSTPSSTSNAALSTSGYQSPLTEPLTGGKRGGTLVELQSTDFEHLDPGIAYYSLDYEVVFATQRPLYSQKPNSTEETPDMAEGPPEISADGKTVTVHLKTGIRFSPPVNREVTSEDVAYAIERGTNPNVANPYIASYFKAIEGEPTDTTGGPMKGIETPNQHEIVFHLTEPKGQLVADALLLPLTAAVPKSYAEKFDKNKPSNYSSFEVATGPYMLKNDAEGKVLGIGYVPGKSATLVRNPNWNPKTDYRPAYLNEIQIKIGGTAPVIGRQVLEGTNVVDNEPPAQASIRLAAEKYKSQMEISPGAGSHYIGVNNKVGPFKNIDLRKAFWAALDRTAMDKARGGELVTNVATHYIYPTINGFEQGGGLKGPQGPQFDFNAYPEGNMQVAEKYLKLAGYPSGKYTGGETVTVVGATEDPAEEDAEIVEQTLKNLGFPVKFSLEETSTMYAKYCNVPKEEITVCPSVGWIADFADPQTVINITFNGTTIVPTGNVNWGQTNVPKINAAMAAAENVTGNEARAKAWGKIDVELVEDATDIPFDWDKQASLEGNAVAGVGDIWDVGEWDYDYTSLK
jgi:peptide/nickel transport system substrate-binding protein